MCNILAQITISTTIEVLVEFLLAYTSICIMNSKCSSRIFVSLLRPFHSTVYRHSAQHIHLYTHMHDEFDMKREKRHCMPLYIYSEVEEEEEERQTFARE